MPAESFVKFAPALLQESGQTRKLLQFPVWRAKILENKDNNADLFLMCQKPAPSARKNVIILKLSFFEICGDDSVEHANRERGW